ncbi:hypothetical protein OIO90_005957 [Microbotryomycetes sp. JL221]|nr:hypothetical protein OIO90_005957 [Microbotryomycetes sp. JL221]
MDKFNSFASQAKAKSDAMRIGAMNKIDHQFASHRTGNAQASGSTTPPPPPTPPLRSRATSNATPPSSSNPSRPSHNAHPSTTVFANIDDHDKQALFALLDEYFQSRPQYKHLINTRSSTTSAPVIAPSPRVDKLGPPRPPPRSVSSTALGTATAMYDFQAQTGQDLAFNEGDKITVLEHVSSDWWKGELRGQTGIFPCTYVQMDS